MNKPIGQIRTVLDKGWIELVDFMPHPLTGVSGDLAIVNAARTSFLGESKGHDADKKLLFYLLRNKHTTPFEQVQFKFRVHAPVVTWWQWVRHRTFSFNAQSGRYVEFEEDQFYIPDVWRKQSKDNKQGSSDEVLDSEDYKAICKNLYNSTWFDWFTESGGISEAMEAYFDVGYQVYRELLKRGAAKEQARLFLPGWGLYYTWVMSIDAHNLMNFLRLRMDPHAQYEIRVYAETIYNEFFKPLLPWTAEAFEEYIFNGK